MDTDQSISELSLLGNSKEKERRRKDFPEYLLHVAVHREFVDESVCIQKSVGAKVV